MWKLINKIFHITDKKEWLEQLFKNIEHIWTHDRQVHCKIIDIKNRGFVVKVEGMYAYLPFKCMPWKYARLQHWNLVYPSLKGKVFTCKITDAARVENKLFSIHVDATTHRLRDVEPTENTEYTGVVLQKSQYGAFVEIGCHFEWKYGSIVGLLHRTYFANEKSFENYNAGETISVIYAGKSYKGPIFMESTYYSAGPNWHSDKMKGYLGREMRVNAYENDGQLSFFVENQYPVQLSGLPENFYANETNAVQCKIYSIDYRNNCFRAHWISPAATYRDKTDWYSDEIAEYIEREVNVNIYKNGARLCFFVENRYPARLSAKKPPENFDANENKVVRCKIQAINYNKGYFMLQWAKPSKAECAEIDWYSTKIEKYIGREMPVNVYESDGRLNFFIYNRYPAKLSVKLPENFALDNDFVQCKIRSIDRNNACFDLQWTGPAGCYDIDWRSAKIERYVGREVSVNVYQDENEPLLFVENRYPARLSGLPKNFAVKEILRGKIHSIDYDNELFDLQWAGPYGCADIEWRSAKIGKYVGRKVRVKVYTVDETPVLFVENRYPAKIAESEYPKIAGKDLVHLRVRSIDYDNACFRLQSVDSNFPKKKAGTSTGKIIDLLDSDTINKLRTISSERQANEDQT